MHLQSEVYKGDKLNHYSGMERCEYKILPQLNIFVTNHT